MRFCSGLPQRFGCKNRQWTAAQKAAGDWEHRQPAACLTQKIHRVYLKRRKYRLFLQTQRDFALKSLGIYKGFRRLFALNSACVCEISVIFFVFRYTLNTSAFMPHPLPNFMRTPNPVRVLDTRKFSEQNFWGQASCTLPCVAVYLSVRF